MNEQELQAALAAIAKAKETSEADYAAMQEAAKIIYEACDELGTSLRVQHFVPWHDERVFGIKCTDEGDKSRRWWALGLYCADEYRESAWLSDFDRFNVVAMTKAFHLLPTFLEGWAKAIQEESAKRTEAARIAKLAEAAFSELLEKLKK